VVQINIHNKIYSQLLPNKMKITKNKDTAIWQKKALKNIILLSKFFVCWQCCFPQYFVNFYGINFIIFFSKLINEKTKSLIQNVCYPTDIEIPGNLASSIVILFLITLILIAIAYFSVMSMIKAIVWRIKWIVGLYFFVLVALMLYAFISISKISTSSK